MAAPMKNLNQHAIFSHLRLNKEKNKPLKESKRLIAVKDGEIFLWDDYKASVLTTNLKSWTVKNDSRDSSYQTLLPSHPPVYEIDVLQFNQSGSLLAAIGQRGISVLQLPQKWGKYAEFEGGKSKITCKTVPIGERFFTTNSKIKVAQASWHPGSITDTHLVVLTSDNYLRIFNVSKPDAAEQTFSLSPDAGYGTISGSRSNISLALGDMAVAFDFGPPLELQKRRTATLDGSSADKSDQQLTVWPVFLLWGNGDVYTLLVSVNQKPSWNTRLQGPLSMHPPAEDNYGTDACALLCLRTCPPVLVVATSGGKLYHCVVLDREEGDDAQSEASWTGPEVSTFYTPPQEPSLFVYESVELELSLTTVTIETDEMITDDFSCPIRLHQDAACSDRYHCSHSAGVHSVQIPWSHNFNNFCKQEDNVEPPTPEQDAVVEHLICTKPLPTSPASPVVGVDVTSEQLLGPTLICLTSTLECIALPLVSNQLSDPPPLLCNDPVQKLESPLRKLNREPFNTHVQRLLLRSSSNPILKSDTNADITQQECFQLLSRATQVFREEYIQKQDLAQQEIERRVRVLSDHKEQQQSDLKECSQMRNILTDKAGELAEKYEDAAERQQRITGRLEVVLKNLQTRIPVVSEAEKDMHKELKKMEENLKHYKNAVQQVKIKQEYQAHQLSGLNSSVNKSSPSFNKSQTQQLRTLLKDESDKISGLVKQVNHLKIHLTT